MAHRLEESQPAFRLPSALVPFALLWAGTWAAMHFGHWLSIVLIAPAAGFRLRLFMLQDDCGHSSFFGRRSLNDWKGRAIGVLTLTPYDWRCAHVEHHAAADNLDERGVGDITTPAVAECEILTRRGRLISRISPAWLFLSNRCGRSEWFASAPCHGFPLW